jgi:hypothetical protein
MIIAPGWVYTCTENLSHGGVWYFRFHIIFENSIQHLQHYTRRMYALILSVIRNIPRVCPIFIMNIISADL